MFNDIKKKRIELLKAKLKIKTSSLANTSLVKKIKKDIARALTEKNKKINL